jgi:aconitate hydratase
MKYVTRELYAAKYADVFKGDENWQAVEAPESQTYAWDDNSTYVQNPPYFEGMGKKAAGISDIKGARVLGLFGDKITTDHISPAGSIKAQSPAGSYLMDHGVGVADFNQYGTRRGNHEVMMRGTFANIRLRNHMLGPNGREGGYTFHYPSREEVSIFDAAMQYKSEGVPLVIFAGVEYGNGSSRDWAAKGTNLLGRPRGHRPVLRAYPPFQPGRHGRHPVRLRRRHHLGEPWPEGRRDRHHRGPGRTAAAREEDRQGHLLRRNRQGRAAGLPRRYAG